MDGSIEGIVMDTRAIKRALATAQLESNCRTLESGTAGTATGMEAGAEPDAVAGTSEVPAGIKVVADAGSEPIPEIAA